MLRLGAHESIAGGLFRALERASEVGCECVQIWTKNSRQWRSPPLSPCGLPDQHRFAEALSMAAVR